MTSQTIRKFTFAATAAVLMAGAVSAATIQTSGWTRVAPAAGGFTVNMPGAAEHKATPISTESGPITMHTYGYDDGRFAYAVFYGDLAFKPSDPVIVLNAVRDGNAKGGRLVEEKEFTFNGLQGKSVTIEKDGFYVFNRVLVVGNRVFQVMFTMRKADDVPESANTFIQSFRLAN